MKKSKRDRPIEHMDEKKAHEIVASEVAKSLGIKGSVKEIERIGSTILQTNQQVILLIEQILWSDFKFDEKQLNMLRNKIKEGLTNLVYLEGVVQRPLQLKDIAQIVELGKENYLLEQAKDAGIILPQLSDKLKLGKVKN